MCFLARFWRQICTKLFLIYLHIFLRSLRLKNDRFYIVFIAVKFFKKLTKKSQFWRPFRKFRKSMNFSKKSGFLTKFHFAVDWWVFNKKLQFFFSSECWDLALFRFCNVLLTAPIPLARFWDLWNPILTKYQKFRQNQNLARFRSFCILASIRAQKSKNRAISDLGPIYLVIIS